MRTYDKACLSCGSKHFRLVDYCEGECHPIKYIEIYCLDCDRQYKTTDGTIVHSKFNLTPRVPTTKSISTTKPKKLIEDLNPSSTVYGEIHKLQLKIQEIIDHINKA